jgi:hypothetical protein
MRIFNQLVFDGYVNGTTAVYSNPALYDLLGATDQLSVTGYTAQVTVGSGTPTLTVQVEHSADSIRWINRNTAAEIAAATLSTSTETPVQGHDGNPNTRPTLGFARLRIALGTLAGSSPAGQVRLWVIGRDRSET